MPEIKPIETYYNGYKFRSRLEARWAVFFDAMEICYEYEPEGFNLDDNLSYLPDFYLPNLDAYFEVKGLKAFKILFPDNRHVLFEPDREKPDKFAEFAFEMYKSHPIIIVFGDPLDAFLTDKHGGKGEAHVFYEAECGPLFFGKDVIQCENDECALCDGGRYMCSVTIAYMDNEHIICPADNESWIHTLPAKHETVIPYAIDNKAMVHETTKIIHQKQFLKSLMISRQARFEYGERPITERNYRR